MTFIGMSITDVVQYFVNKKVNVSIIKTDEAWACKDWHYVVVPAESNNFWIDSFETQKQAVEFCKKFGLKIV